MVRRVLRTKRMLLGIPVRLTVGLILLALLATSCELNPTHTPRESDQWSNGLMLGMATLNQLVPIQVDEEQNAYLLWVGLEKELVFVRLNERAEVILKQSLDLSTDSPVKPQLLLDGRGQLHLTWLNKWERSLRLYYARVSSEGEVLQEATALSTPEQRAAHVSMVLDSIGQTVEVFWSDSHPSRPGAYHTALDWSGEVVVPTEMFLPDGITPVAQMDGQGFVHLAWREEPEIEEPAYYYAVYDPQGRLLGPKAYVAKPSVQTGLVGRPTAGTNFIGPFLGLDGEAVYVAWVLEVRELGSRMAFTFYQSFPPPALSRSPETLDYLPPEVSADVVQVRGVDPAMTGDPRFLNGQPAEQLLTCYTLVVDKSGLETLQIVAVDLGTGQVQGQEVVSAGRAASLRPSVAEDPKGDLHLSWIDTAGFERYEVVYASTSAEVKDTLNRITTYEVMDSIFSVVAAIISALFFLPMVVGWVFLPIGWLIVFSMVTRSPEIADLRGRVALGLAMLLQVVSKVFLFPNMLTQFPFSSQMSPSLSLILGRWIFPLLLAAIGAGVVWRYLRRTHNESLFAAYGIFAGVDSLLTLIFYVALPRV